MSKYIIRYGVLVFILISVFHFSQYLFKKGYISLDTLLASTAILFILLGFWIANKLLSIRNPKPNLILMNDSNNQNETLTNREMDVLILLSKGYTNKQISDELFVSLNTTKTHLSNIYSKLGTQNRVQTVKTAQSLNII